MDDPTGQIALRMNLTHRATLAVAARAIADTAAGLGLSGTGRTQVEALFSEALTAVIADSFDGAAAIDVDVEVGHQPGRLDVLLHQRGAPSSYVSGQLPVRLETLLSLGYADSMHFSSDGVHGSTMRISRALSAHTLIEDAEFVADTELTETTPANLAELTIRPITEADVIDVARLYFRVYGYTKIGSPWIYEPEVFCHKLTHGLHVAVVAQLPSGQIIGHAGILRSTPTSPSAAGGPVAVDPAYRGLGVSGRMGMELLNLIHDLHLRGTYGLAVTAHPASQKMFRNLGGREVGLVLARQPPELDFRGFDAPTGFRRAVMVLYTSFGQSEPTEVYVPTRYREIIERIYAHARLPRTAVSELRRPPAGLPEQSLFQTELAAETKYAQITVQEYGDDFVEALQGLLERFEREGFATMTVHLPLNNQLTCYFSAGLSELGLSFAAVFPEQEHGDELILEMTVADQDAETIAVASDFGRELRDFVIADRDSVTRTQHARARSRATMARILDNL